MNERGLWELFFKTGLPEAYLALSSIRKERFSRPEELARTAFRPKIEEA